MKDGWNAFLYACFNGFGDIASYLANSCHANINVVDKNLKNALHWSCRCNNSKITRLLLDLGIK